MSTKVSRARGVDEMASAPDVVTSDEVAARAYEIYLSGTGGDAVDNWLRAEAELSPEANAQEPPFDSEEEAAT